VPISEADMVMQMGLHMAETGMVNSAYTKWKKRPTPLCWNSISMAFCLHLPAQSGLKTAWTFKA
ncbi:MAG: hypothetical protein P8Q87_06760, partial [Candidatus Poseidonia sp.]|nr:hypothetical protein [Poseidonia sp.]